MTQQIINVGAAANDRTGDTWRGGMIKANNNFTELYGFQTNNVVVINKESDFPVQNATTITLQAGICYFLGDVIITGKRFICESGSALKSNTGFNISLVCNGSGNLFTLGANVLFELTNIGISCPLANMFDFNGATALDISNVAVFACQSIGTFVAGTSSSIVVDNFAINPAGNGFDFSGNWNLFSMMRISDNATSAAHKFLDLGTSTFDDFNLSRCNPNGPAGSVFIDGATDSDNINTGRLAVVIGCTISGGMTTLIGVTSSDIRWDFQLNSPIQDSRNAVDLFLTGGSETITTGSAGDWQEIGVPSGGGISWSSDISSRFTVGTNGALTYIGERPIDVKMSGRATVEKSGGGADVLEVRIAKNWDGTASDAGLEKSRAQTQNADPTTVPVGALTNLVTNDNIRVIFSNVSGASNIIASVSSLEITG